MSGATTCKICQGQAAPLARALVLGKHDVGYYRCARCGFTQTDEPFWLDEAYADAITASDLGLVGRNLLLARLTRSVITLFFDAGGRFLDYGAGYGLLVRLLRDQGLDFRWHDQFCANLFARGCEADLGAGRVYELLTAFEVFEHLVDPVPEVERMLGYAPSVLFTTQLLPAEGPPPGQWWYYGLEHGQHVAIYTRAALERLAERVGCNLYSDGAFVHLLTPRRLPQALFRLAVRRRLSALIGLATRRPSLLDDDYAALVGQRFA